MRIGFYSLQLCYVSLIDWTRIWNWMGARLFPTRMRLVFDGNCQLCRRTIAMLRTLDVLNRVDFINGLDRGALRAAGLDHIPEDALLADMHGVEGDRISTGYDAYRRLSLRVPPLWLLVPVLYLPFVRAIGMKIYRRVADSRTCSLVPTVHADGAIATANERVWIRNTIAVGYGLFMMVALCSLAKFHSWPFAGYPTFEGISGPELRFLTVHISTPSGEREVSVQELYHNMNISAARLLTLTGRIIALPASADRERKFCALWTEIATVAALPRDAKLTFYEELFSTYPEDRGKPPLQRQRVFETTACRGDAALAAR
jgi:predicted DCC family thiol-disulfide oxidoreductase YuxK